MKSFEQKFIVELSDINTSFGLKSTSVFKYYQETFARYCAKYNVAGYDVYQMGLKWVIGQTIIEFEDIIPIWNEEVTATVYVSNIKKLRLYMNFEIKTQRGIVAKGQSTMYILDIETSRPQPIETVSKYLDIDNDQLNGEILKNDISYECNLLSENTHTISFSDMDYNNHTNNISYISLGFEKMPVEYLKQYRPKICDIRYLQETFLNDTLKCDIYQKDNYFEYKITTTKDNSLVCVVKSIWQNSQMKPTKFFEILNELRNNNMVAIK